jgi:hypothetical protein
MTTADPLTSAREEAFAALTEVAARLRAAEDAALEERDLLERAVDSGEVDALGDEYLLRLGALSSLEEQALAYRDRLEEALDELTGLEALALAQRGPEEVARANREAARRLAAADLDLDRRLGWLAVGQAAAAVASGVDPASIGAVDQPDPGVEPVDGGLDGAPMTLPDPAPAEELVWERHPAARVAPAPRSPAAPSRWRPWRGLRRGQLLVAAAITVVVAVALGVLGATVGGGPAPAPGAGSANDTRSAAARGYLAAVGGVNATEPAFFAHAATWTAATSSATAQAQAAPLARQLRSVDGRLLSLAMRYPPASDPLLTVVNAVGTLEADLTRLDRLPSIGVAPWTRRYRTDLAALTGASDAARAALGLSKA